MAEAVLEAAARPPPSRSLASTAARRLLRNRAALLGAGLLAFIVVVSVLGPWVSPHALDAIYWDLIATPPSLEHGFLFGTDANGRDLLTRVLYGGRISLTVGLIAALVSALIGVVYGAVSGYLGGAADNLMMRTVELLYAMPFMFLVILLMVLFGRNVFLIFLAIGAIEWLDVARISRGQALALRNGGFVQAAVAMGAAPRWIIARHILPNVAGPVVVYLTVLVPRVILLESFLSFIGLGVDEPLTSWGVLISDGAREMETAPWMLLTPAVFLSGTLFAFHCLGNGLRDALDPRESR